MSPSLPIEDPPFRVPPRDTVGGSPACVPNRGYGGQVRVYIYILSTVIQ
jgi:hypothetical protein